MFHLKYLASSFYTYTLERSDLLVIVGEEVWIFDCDVLGGNFGHLLYVRNVVVSLLYSFAMDEIADAHVNGFDPI